MTKLRAPHRKYEIPDEPDRIRLTPDDDEILREMFRNDIMDSAAVFARFPHRSPTVLRARLRKLAHNRYLHRLHQVEEMHVPRGGSLPIPYVLAAKGADRLLQVYGLKLQRQRRAYQERARKMKLGFLLHGLEQTRFITSLRGEAEADGGVEFLYPDEIYERYEPTILEREKLPGLIKANVASWHGHSIPEGTLPDGFFQLIDSRRPEGQQRRNIFLEIDRGTETIAPAARIHNKLAFWKPSSLLRKFVVYHCAQMLGVHKQEFGIPVFQVLTVTTNRERVLKMQAAIQKYLAGKPHHTKPHWFLFTDQESIRESGGVLKAPIFDASGKENRLVSF